MLYIRAGARPLDPTIRIYLNTLYSARSYASVTENSKFNKWREQQSTKGSEHWRRSQGVFNSQNIMATPTKVHLTLKDGGVFKLRNQTQEAADKTSELLQENHTVWHPFSSISILYFCLICFIPICCYKCRILRYLFCRPCCKDQS